jgi:tripartite-type tricarboxylate transporter receptor subunit TctC
VADLTVRIVAQQLGQSLGQAVVIDNKPGASCWVASDAVAKAASGGHTLLLMSNATAVNAGLFKSLSFNSNCAFAPIATLGCFDITLDHQGQFSLQNTGQAVGLRPCPPPSTQPRYDQSY